MSRTFDGSAGSDQQIVLDVGAIAGDGGPITVLTLWRPAELVAGVLVTGVASGSSTWGYIEGGDGSYYFNGDFSGVPLVDVGEWQIIGYSKAATSSTVRWHFRDSSGAWTHVDGDAVGDQGAPTAIWIGNGQGGLGGLRLDGEWVCSALWDDELSDGAVEAAGSLTALQDWADADPGALWDGDQDSTSDPVVDRTGGGADEISAPSTANPPAVGGADPPGWSYTLSSGVTGSGAVVAPSAVVAGSGTVGVAGTGAAVAPAGQASGAGTVATAGSGAAVAPAAAVAGSGTVAITGAGAVVAPAAVVSGVGETVGAPVEAIIVGAVTGPRRARRVAGAAVTRPAATGPRARRGATGPATSRTITGPEV